MATIVNVPGDTRWENMGRSLGDAFSSYLNKREEEKKKQDTQEALRKAMVAQTPEDFANSVFPVVEDQEDFMKMMELATQRFGKPGETKIMDLWVQNGIGAYSKAQVEVGARGTQEDAIRKLQEQLAPGSVATTVGPGQFPELAVDPQTMKPLSGQTGARISDVGVLESAASVRAKTQEMPDRLQLDKRQVAAQEKQAEAAMKRAEADAASAGADAVGGKGIEWGAVRGELRNRGLSVNGANADRMANLMKAKDGVTEYITKLQEDPAGVMAAAIGSGTISARKTYITERANELLEQQFDKGKELDVASIYTQATNEAVKKYPASIETGKMGQTPTVSTEAKDTPIQLQSGQINTDELSIGQVYEITKSDGSQKKKMRWTGMGFQEVK